MAEPREFTANKELSSKMLGTMSDGRKIDELDIRQYFMYAELSEALSTHAICEGILSMRQLQQPQRKRRKDAGVKRTEEQQRLNGD